MPTLFRLMAAPRSRVTLSAVAMAALVIVGCSRSPSTGVSEAPRAPAPGPTSLDDDVGSRPRLSAMDTPNTAIQPACERPFSDVDALCACLEGQDGERTCEASQAAHPLGAPRLFVVTWGASPGARTYSLVAREGGGVRLVARLGTDFEPGALGIHGEVEIEGGEALKVGGREVVVVRSEQRSADLNAAGLEVCLNNTRFETICALGEGSRPTRCVSVPVSTEWGCEQGVEAPDDAMDEQRRALLAALQKGWGISRAELSWSLADDGAVDVQVKSGTPEGATAQAVGRHPLF